MQDCINVKTDGVAALILNYNGFGVTRKCIDNILLLDKVMPIIVVDNCSNDESYEKLQSIYKYYDNVYVIKTMHNKGYADGNNFGFNYIITNFPEVKYVMLLNPDILVQDKETICCLKRALDNDNHLSLVSCQIIFNGRWRGKKDFGWKFPSYKYLLWQGSFLGKVILKEINDVYEEVNVNNNIMIVDVVPGCFFMARLTDLNKVGFFDPHTFLYYEETILARKLSAIKKKEGIVIGRYVYHNHDNKDNDLKNYSKRLLDRKRFYQSKRHYVKYYSGLPPVQSWLCLTFMQVDYCLKKIVYGTIGKMNKWDN